ncbi:MAG: MFS transporter [Lachnospiraceae bacterium]|nr:MFS transporter [Lachnospiraceae bacterium]
METKKKVPTINKVAYALGTGGGNVFSQIAAAFLLQYYTDTALIGAGAIATMFLVCRVFDGISDLVMGGVIDKTRTKWGKARPWLIISGPLSLLGIVLLMNVPMSLSDGGKLVYAYVTYIFMAVIVYTIYGIANTAMLPLMTKNPDEHTMLATFAAVGNNAIGLVAGSAITPLVMNYGWKVSSIVLGLVACVLILFSGLMNKEVGTEDNLQKKEAIPMKQQLPAVLKNKYFFLLLLVGVFTLLMNANAIGAQIYYCNFVLGNMGFMSVLMIAGQLPGLLILFLMPYISKKYSKQAFLLIGSVFLILGFVISGLAGSNTTMLVIGTVIRSLGAGPLLSAVFALVPDVVEYGYWKFGIRSEGLISSAQSVGSKVGIGLGSALTGWILAAVGYNPTELVQSAAVVNAVKFDYTWLGAIFSVVILLIVLMLNVEKYADQYRKAE